MYQHEAQRAHDKLASIRAVEPSLSIYDMAGIVMALVQYSAIQQRDIEALKKTLEAHGIV